MYGVLKSATNTGLDSELQYIFSTPLSIVSNQPAYISDTLSLKRKTNSQKVQRWEISAEIVPTNNSSSFLVHSVAKGFTEVFYLRMPQVYSPTKISQTLSLTLTNSALSGSTTINISGSSGVDLTGQFINFTGNSKVYLITSNGNGLGNGLAISPPLLTNISATTAIISGDKVTMQARYNEDTQLGITYIDGVLASQGNVSFIEAL
jgi:hypothetical protein